jgi:peptidylprolyl isomerase/peptidyl-prolyl cis-trans isomerase D
MAILNSIRKRGVFLIVIIAIALFSFIFSDVIKNGGFSTEKSLTIVATVNGENMPREAFMKKVETTQRSLGPSGTTAQAINSVWDRELRAVLQNQQYEELGLAAQPEKLEEEMSKGLATNATFQDEAGNYSPGKVQEYVANVKLNNNTAYLAWLDYEESLKSSSLQNTYYNMIKGGLRSTLNEGEKQYRFENDKRNLQYVFVPYTKIPDADVEVTDAEITSYVKNHADDFEVAPQVDIQYVSFSEAPSDEDIADAEADIVSFLNDKEFFNKVTNQTETVKGLKNTTAYAEFVNSNSDAAFQDRFFFKKELPASIADTLFASSVGSIYGPYKVGNTNNISKVIEEKVLPDSVQSKHILIRYKGSLRASDAITRTKEDAKKLADSLNGALKSTPSKFKDLAIAFSDDKSNSEKGGDLGFSGPGRMVPAFDAFIFDNAVGTVGVVETDFGFHIVGVEDQRNKQRAIKVATITKEVEASEKTLNNVFSKASKFEVASQKGDFAEVSKSGELALKPVNKIGELDANIPGVGNNRTIVNWAFNEETEVGSVKRFSINDGYVIVQLTRKSPKGLMSVAESSGLVAPKLRNEKKAVKIRAAMTGETLQEMASSQGVTVQTATAITMAAPTLAGAGSEPLVVGAAFAKAAGESTGLLNGEKGVFKVKVLAENNAPDLETYANYSNQLNNAATPAVNTKVYQALKKAADIEDNRANMF